MQTSRQAWFKACVDGLYSRINTAVRVRFEFLYEKNGHFLTYPKWTPRSVSTSDWKWWQVLISLERASFVLPAGLKLSMKQEDNQAKTVTPLELRINAEDLLKTFILRQVKWITSTRQVVWVFRVTLT